MNKTKAIALPLILGLSMIGGVVATYAGLASAQTANTATVTPTPSVVVSTTGGTSSTNAPADVHQGHAPIGQDGNVTAISGTSITMQEESDEGGAIYTVDASGATFMKDGATGTIASIAVGDKIFVHGTVTGTNVVATSVMDGHPQGGMHGMFGGHDGPNGQ